MSRFGLLALSFSLAGVSLAQTPVVTEGGVVNAASFAPGQVVTPGSLVAIFGANLAAGLSQADTIPLSSSLGGVSVTFNNIPAPLLFVSQGQVNAQLPWNALPEGTTAGTARLVVTRSGVSSAPQTVSVGPFSPGIFALNNIAIAVNLNGSIAAPPGAIPGFATEPAAIGSTIIVYCTGLGTVDPPAQTGNHSLDALRRTTTTPTVLIGGREAEVGFSGMSPQFVGVNQLNVVVPNVPPGDAVPLQIRMGGITSTDRVTIAVRAAGS